MEFTPLYSSVPPGWLSFSCAFLGFAKQTQLWGLILTLVERDKYVYVVRHHKCSLQDILMLKQQLFLEHTDQTG